MDMPGHKWDVVKKMRPGLGLAGPGGSKGTIPGSKPGSMKQPRPTVPKPGGNGNLVSPLAAPQGIFSSIEIQ